MRVFLIVPPVLFAQQAPISIAYLAAYLKSRSHDVQVWDLNTEISIPNDADEQYWQHHSHCRRFFENHRNLFQQWVEKILDFTPRVVGFSVWDTTEFFAVKMAEMLKKKDKNILTVFGGFWCTLFQNKLMSYDAIDAIVYGEGELTLTDIVENYDHRKNIQGCLIKYDGEIKDCGAREEIDDLDKLPFPDLSFFPLEKYLYKDRIPISFSRGCNWRCVYCVTNCHWKNFRIRTAENIYKEIIYRLKEFPTLKDFFICDSSINQDVDIFSHLCDLIIENGIKVNFSGFAQIKPRMPLELLKKIRKAGFSGFCYGIESGSQKILNKMRRPYTTELAERVIRDTDNADIATCLSFIVGFPGETDEDFQNTLNFIERVKNYVTYISSANECVIPPATHIANNIQEYGINYKNKGWETQDTLIEERKERVKIFNDFVKNLGILNIPSEERKRIAGLID